MDDASVSRVLRALSSNALPANLDEAEFAAAKRHRVDLALLRRFLRERPDALTSRQRAEAEAALRAASALNERLLDELVRVLSHLNAAGIPGLVLKGPALALLLYDDLGVRRCRDLDVLVPEEHVIEARRVVEAIGFRSDPPDYRLGRELHLFDQTGELIVDLHWNVVGNGWPFALDFADAWAERRLIRWRGAELPVPAPEWLFVASCLYLVKDYPAPELVYLADLSRLLACFPHLMWDRVAALAGHTGTCRICALALILLREIGAAPVPAPARELFAPEAAVQGAAHRVRRALGDQRIRERFRDLPGPWKMLAHASFRERRSDKLRVYLALVPYYLGPDPKDVLEGRRGLARVMATWLRRAGKIGPGAVSSLRFALRSLGLRVGALVPDWHTRPAPGSSLHLLEEAGVLFAAPRQELYALSPSAAFLWCCFAEGYSLRDTANRYAVASGCSWRVARAKVVETVRAWRGMGLLDVPLGQAITLEPPCAGGPVATDAERPVVELKNLPVRRRYRLLGTTFEVGFPDQALCHIVDPALRHLATSDRPNWTAAVTADAETFGLVIDGLTADRCTTVEALAPMVKGNLNAAAVNCQDFALYLHAAMLRRGGAALLLPAAPGSGKTCLAAALAKCTGFAYHTDEITLLERGTLKARGATVALTVKDGGWSVLEPLYPEICGLTTHRRVDGALVKYLPPPIDPGDPALNRPYAVRWVIFPSYVPAGPNHIEPLPRMKALQLLLDECLALRLMLDSKNVEGLVAWISEIECHLLTFNNLPIAVQLIHQVCAEPAAAGRPNTSRAPRDAVATSPKPVSKARAPSLIGRDPRAAKV